jgi:hypothetical protein
VLAFYQDFLLSQVFSAFVNNEQRCLVVIFIEHICKPVKICEKKEINISVW